MSLLEKVSHLKVETSSPVTEGLTLEMVLENRAPSPFTLREFAEYLDQTYCSENLSFYLAVTDYRQSVRLYFGTSSDTLDMPVHLQDGRAFSFRQSEAAMLNHEERIRFDTLKAKFQDIIDRFILTDAPQEINIPYELRQQLLKIHREQQSYHPALLKPVCVAVVELMRISAFIPFATDLSRLEALPTPSKSTSMTTTATSTSSIKATPGTASPRRLRSSPALGTPQNEHIPPVPTATESDSPNTILRKLTNTLRIRTRSQSPPRLYSWKYINLPDPTAFLSSGASSSSPNTPAVTPAAAAAAAPPMERGFSASSSISSVSSASSPDSNISSSRYHSISPTSATANRHYHDTPSAFHPFTDLVEVGSRFFSSFGDTKGHSSSS
ncbi:hypothetical protein VTP01DRAFT_1209 [Rhizomucor pusillus]|uniref:uncharacterized protein n=1 Tax=Rhizomucor pusillus TaxID=4840 RepID=UPI003742A8C4